MGKGITLLLALGMAAFGQENIHYASLEGRVTDASGSVIEGADVTARQAETHMNPGRPGFQALFASIGAGLHIPDFFYMRTRFQHGHGDLLGLRFTCTTDAKDRHNRGL